MNPFVSAWQENSQQAPWILGTPGPTFGALPTMSPIPYAMVFNFVSPTSSILNCNVTGTNSLIYFHVTSTAGTTTIIRRSGELYATINWSNPSPTIHTQGSHKMHASQWARLSNDARRRVVTIGGREYAWIPRGNAICLHSDDASKSGEVARITKSTANSMVSLQLTVTAFNAGFFESCVLATVLFLSGRNID